MNFTDYAFVPVLLITVVLYYIFPKKARWTILLIASLLFYCTWGVELIPFAVGAALIAWIFSFWIEKRYKKQDNCLGQIDSEDKVQKQRLQKKIKRGNLLLLWVAIVLIFGVLVFTKLQKTLASITELSVIVEFCSNIYKYSANLCSRIPWVSYFVNLDQGTMNSTELAFIVPLGISYYSMSLVGYLADVYWKKEKAEVNFFKLLLFTVYFPKILEGPISKHRNISKTLYNGNKFDYQKFCFGFQRMLWGYIKKLVISDRLNLMASNVISNYSSYGGSEIIVSFILAAFVLYCDFSGCMDIALGASELFGVTIEENFNHPFFSRSAAEFWRRWHISLGTWFKDYIYMPLVVNPVLIKISGKIRKIGKIGKRLSKAFITIIPLSVVWLLTGLWHGTGMNYIVWGIYWGILIIISNVFEKEFKGILKILKIKSESAWYRCFQIFRTFLLFVISRIISMPKTLEDTIEILRRIIFVNEPWHLVNGDLFSCGLNRPNMILGVASLVILYFVSRKQEKGVMIRAKIAELPLVVRWIIYLLGIAVLFVFGIYGAGYDASSFVYMNY